MCEKYPQDSKYDLPDDVNEQVRNALPELFSNQYKSVLYVGANYLRQHFLKDFVDNYDRVTVLEIFQKNVKYLNKKYIEPHVEIIHGDVRDAAKLLSSGKFDVCFFYHGPEHLSEDETKPVLGMLENMTKHLIVTGMPHGHYEQGSVYGNDHETHLWHIYPEDMHKIGYETDTLGDADHRFSNMIAWKHL